MYVCWYTPSGHTSGPVGKFCPRLTFLLESSPSIKSLCSFGSFFESFHWHMPFFYRTDVIQLDIVKYIGNKKVFRFSDGK